MSKRAAPLFLLVALLAPRADAANVVVRYTTVLGNFDIELCTEISDACPGVAPITVANFLRYVDENVYPAGMFIHRRGVNFGSPPVIQGGSFWMGQNPEGGYEWDYVPTFAPIALELGENLSNLRGTIAMARSTEPDTATSGWFVNLQDNVNLDTAGGGYAVFGKVVSGIEVVDAIGALTIMKFAAPFNELPVVPGWPGGTNPIAPYLVYVSDISRVPEPGAVGTASAAILALSALARRRRG